MTRICQSRITREFQTRKVNSVWPETIHGPVPEHLAHPACNGTVTYEVSAVSEGCPCCSGSSEIEIKMTCSRCKNPYVPGCLRFPYESAKFLTDLLNEVVPEPVIIHTHNNDSDEATD